MLNENENKLVYRIEAYGTADFIVHHIHAFTIMQGIQGWSLINLN